MTDAVQSHDDNVPAAQMRRDWVTPTVRRLSAGSAEDGANSSPDAGVNPS